MPAKTSPLEAWASAHQHRKTRPPFALDVDLVDVRIPQGPSDVGLANLVMLVGRDVVRPVQAQQFFLRIAERADGSRIGEDDPAVGVIDDNALGHVQQQLLVEGLQSVQRIVDPLAHDRRAQSAGRRLERIDLALGPLPILDAVVKANEAPAGAFDKDRHQQKRADGLRRHRLLFLRLEVLDPAHDGLLVFQQPCPAGEAAPGAREVLESGVVDLRFDAHGHPLEPLAGKRAAGVIGVEGKQVGAAGIRRLAEPGQDVFDARRPGRGLQELLSGEGDGLQDGLSPLHGALGTLALADIDQRAFVVAHASVRAGHAAGVLLHPQQASVPAAQA